MIPIDIASLLIGMSIGAFITVLRYEAGSWRGMFVITDEDMDKDAADKEEEVRERRY